MLFVEGTHNHAEDGAGVGLPLRNLQQAGKVWLLKKASDSTQTGEPWQGKSNRDVGMGSSKQNVEKTSCRVAALPSIREYRTLLRGASGELVMNTPSLPRAALKNMAYIAGK